MEIRRRYEETRQREEVEMKRTGRSGKRGTKCTARVEISSIPLALRYTNIIARKS